MINLTRRRLLTATLASTAMAGISLAPGREARAAAPLAGTQAPSWYRYKVGSIEVTVVADGVNRFKMPDDIVTNVKREEVNAARRHGSGRSGIQCEQGADRSIPNQSGRDRHRSQAGGYG